VAALRRVPALVGLGLAVSAVVVAGETALCRVVLDHHLPDIVMVYLLGVVLLAIRFGYAASLPATVMSVLAFDFFFTPPYLSFSVQDKSFFLTFVLMAFVASVISNQTERLVRREVRTAKLYAMSRELTVAGSADEMAHAACGHLAGAFESQAWMVLPEPDGERVLGETPGAAPPPAHVVARAAGILASGGRELEEPEASGRQSESLLALTASRGIVGVVVLRSRAVTRLGRASSRELLDAFATQIALGLERTRLAEEAQRAQLQVQTERLRNALLSSVSHDFRTPLGVIKGAVTAIIDQSATMSAARRSEHLQTISEEATRLNRLLRNLLSMTSLEAGTMRAQKEWQPLEDVVGVALNRLDEQLGHRVVKVEIEPSAALAPFDASLIEQVLVNLVENAGKHTPLDLPIRIGARRVGDDVEVEVADEGPGVPLDQREAIFDKFHRVAPGTPGMGLGLTICRGIVTAHGGRIWCDERPKGGAVFRFTLPAAAPPAMGALPELSAEP
jgi:two-component system sensor histidine kinase KdpD